MTPVWVPEGIDWKAVNKTLKNTYGITVAGGQDDFTGKIFRISHLGYYDELDMVTVIAAVERSLRDCGWKCDIGAGARAVERSLAEQR